MADSTLEPYVKAPILGLSSNQGLIRAIIGIQAEDVADADPKVMRR